MERQFQINWAALVKEARLRRKAQRLTQQRLALLAHVSMPTISRFENGEKDLQLSSVMSILGVLGMVDSRRLEFFEPKEREDTGRECILFTGKDGKKKVPCAISLEALEDHFKGSNLTPLKKFAAGRTMIEHEARRKYLAGRHEEDGTILIRTADF